jgi:spermidine synthase
VVSQPPRRVWIGEDEGQTALLIDGVVQSVYVPEGPLGPGYWPFMLPESRPSRALILGVGGGTIIHLLHRRFGPVPTLGIEIDPEVIHLARHAFGLDTPSVEIREADAFAYVQDTSERFDYIAVDLFSGGKIPGTIFMLPFVRAVKRALTPGGVAAWNFFDDYRRTSRVQRLEKVFPRVTVLESSDNIVVHCRPR